jgi:hypothetical protein
MSQQTVGIVIDRLLTDEYLRTQFALNPLETIVGLHVRGFQLTSHEIDILVQTDPRLWFWADADLPGPTQ